MNRLFCCLGLLAVVLATGCMEGPSKPKPIPVSGKVMINGQPAANILVTFTHQTDPSLSATGTTGADGTYKLTSEKLNDGARPGTYKIVFTDSEAEGPKTPAPKTVAGGAPDSMDPNYIAKMTQMAKGETPPAKESRFPSKYGDPKLTPLEKKVEEGNQEFEFDIGK